MAHIQTSFFRAAFLAALFSFLIVLVIGVRSGNAGAQMARETLTIVSSDGRHKFDVEVARSNTEKALGLMFRTKLGAGRGMLFPYDVETVASMWMRNTYISLDMIFITQQGRVHSVVARAEPHSEKIISSNGKVSGVLEIAAGEAARLGIEVGDRVLHAHFESGTKPTP